MRAFVPLAESRSAGAKRGVATEDEGNETGGPKRTRGFGSLTAPGDGEPAPLLAQGSELLSSNALRTGAAQRQAVQSLRGGAPGSLNGGSTLNAPRPGGVRGRGTVAYKVPEVHEPVPMPEEEATSVLKVAIHSRSLLTSHLTLCALPLLRRIARSAKLGRLKQRVWRRLRGSSAPSQKQTYGRNWKARGEASPGLGPSPIGDAAQRSAVPAVQH
jgi:hypothetical protein